MTYLKFKKDTEELLNRHSTIMDNYAPEKSIGLTVDEWGNGFDLEPETNLGFPYQQNTLLKALIAGINVNLFNNHADRIKMATIARSSMYYSLLF